jgi:hypothetical protein
MLYRERDAVYCENDAKDRNALYWQNEEFCCVKVGGAFKSREYRDYK